MHQVFTARLPSDLVDSLASLFFYLSLATWRARAAIHRLLGQKDEEWLSTCAEAKLLLNVERNTEALAAARRAWDLASDHLSEDDPDRAIPLFHLGRALAANDQFEAAANTLERALEHLDPDNGLHADLRSSVIGSQAELCHRQGDPKGALLLYQLALDCSVRHLQSPLEAPINIRVDLAQTMRALGDFEAAHSEFRAALLASEKQSPTDPETLADVQLGLGSVLRSLGRYTEALDHLEAGRLLSLSCYGRGSARHSDCVLQLAYAQARLHDFSDCDASLAEASLSVDCPGFTLDWFLGVQAVAAQERGDLDQACSLFEEAIRLLDPVRPNATILEDYACLLEASGNAEAASRYREKAIRSRSGQATPR